MIVRWSVAPPEHAVQRQSNQRDERSSNHQIARHGSFEAFEQPDPLGTASRRHSPGRLFSAFARTLDSALNAPPGRLSTG